MIVITLLLTNIIGINFLILNNEEVMLSTINISGKQRMQSQRIAFLSELLIDKIEYAQEDDHHVDHGHVTNMRETEILLAQLKNAILTMETDHKALIMGDENRNIPAPKDALKKNYFAEPVSLNTAVYKLVQNAQIIHDIISRNRNHLGNLSDEDMRKAFNAYQVIESLSFHSILQKLENTVFLYEKQGREQVDVYKKIEPILFILSIIVLLVLWYRIFIPLDKELQSTVKAYEEQQEEIEYDRQRLSLATKGTSTGIWDWNITSGDFYWDKTLQDILGFEPDAPQSFNVDLFQSLLHPDHKKAFNKAILEHLRNKTRFHHEVRLFHQKGHYLWTSVRGEALWDENNHAYRMVGSIENITQKKETEIQKNTFIQGIENSGLAFAIMHTSGNRHFHFVTTAFQELTGHDERTLLGRNLNIFTGPETSMSDLDQIDSAIQQNQDITIKILSYRQDGTSFWNAVQLHPIRAVEGESALFYAVIFKDLTHQLLREEQEIQRQRNQSLGELAASVAHEINNLLMPMTMAKDILESELKEDCDPFAYEQLDAIDEYAKQAKTIVEGVLTFARKQTTTLEQANMYHLLRSSVTFIGSLLSQRTSIILEESEDPQITSAKAKVNVTEFRQIIVNLTKNSEQAFEGEKGTISISCSRETLSNADRKKHHVTATDYFVVHVTDNGSGIPKDVIPKIFDPLFTTKDIGSGTGLGLSVVHGIIRSWGGTILVESTQGVGTKFDIYIPIYKDEDDFSYLSDLVDLDPE